MSLDKTLLGVAKSAIDKQQKTRDGRNVVSKGVDAVTNKSYANEDKKIAAAALRQWENSTWKPKVATKLKQELKTRSVHYVNQSSHSASLITITAKKKRHEIRILNCSQRHLPHATPLKPYQAHLRPVHQEHCAIHYSLPLMWAKTMTVESLTVAPKH